jgi:predicted HTH domain antitoxin
LAVEWSRREFPYPVRLEIELDVPEDAVDEALQAELTKEATETAVLRLFANGKISSGRGARMLHIGRIRFLDLLHQRDIPFTVELDDEDFRMLDDWRREGLKTGD